MSETLQDPLRRSRQTRAERTTTSCSECRRRKQKCSQGQPCTNCARRFPLPVCEYKPSKRNNPPGVSSLPTFTVALRSPVENEPGTTSTLLEGPKPHWLKRSAEGQHSRSRSERDGKGGEVGRWSGLDMTTQYPTSVAGVEDMHNWHGDGYPWGYVALNVKTTGNLALCDDSCKKHPQAVHDAIRLILHRFSVPDKFLVRWHVNHRNEIEAYSGEAPVLPATPIGWPDASTDFDQLPMSATKANADLLRIFLKLLCRYKACLDGNPDAANPMIKFYFPFCVQSPLLLQIVLYTSSCFLNETGHMPKLAVMAQKGKAIQMLNEHLRSQPLQTSDAAVAGVVQLVVDEWYWGETADLKAHLRGLREMIRLRGGLRNLGMHGLLAKLVISHDLAIASAHEIKPSLQDGPDFEFDDPVQVNFRLTHNTPFLSTLASFASCAQPLGLLNATASILDDVRFIISAVMTLSPDPSSQDVHKVTSTAKWMLERIQKLDAESLEPNLGQTEGEDVATRNASAGSILAEASSRKSSTSEGSHESATSRTPAARRQSATADTADTVATTATTTASTASTPSSRSSTSPPPADLGRANHMFRVVRLAAIILLRAILNRQPLSKTCTPSEFLEVWLLSWRVPLTVWRSAVGIFNWIMFTIIPASHGGPHERFVRTMWMISVVSRAVENWHVTVESAQVGLRLHRWLAGKNLEGRGPEAGGGVVAKFGYNAPNW